jgi:hypothetical protein
MFLSSTPSRQRRRKKAKRPSPLSQVMAFGKGLLWIWLHHPHACTTSEMLWLEAQSMAGRRTLKWVHITRRVA